MTATFSRPLLPERPNPFGTPQLKAIFVEPLFVVATCLFWLIVLPITGLFCASVTIYDKLVVFSTPKIPFLDLRHTAASNPLVLRRTASSGGEATSSRAGAQPAQA